jgi:endonuclease/exonuclease/phosphatase family metal-dependent hydrolase
MPMHRQARRLCVVVGLAALAAAGLVRARAHTRTPPLVPMTAEDPPLRVLSWNVGRIYLGRGNDSRADDADLARIAAVVREVDPDLVGLQELRERGQVDRLLALLRGDYIGYTADEEINDRRVAMLVRQRPGIEFSQIVTSSGRAAVVARLYGKPRSLTFVAVHLDAFDPAVRRSQAEEIVDWAARSTDRDLIVAGDFNFDADFLLASEPAHPDVGIYRLLTAHFEDVAGGGKATTIVDRRLDYMFARGRLRRRSVRVLEGKASRLMDHAPLVVEFEIRPL